MAMTPSQMLQELEPLKYNTRIGRVIELGLQASTATNAVEHHFRMGTRRLLRALVSALFLLW